MKGTTLKQTLKSVTIDAKGKKLGRVATIVAHTLMGKDLPTFKRNEIPDRIVTIQNVSDLDMSERRLESLNYVSYSGYMGGIRTRTAPEMIAKKGVSSIVYKAVSGMLPKNKLRPLMLKNLVIK
ncbi:MAG: uL13 family ribosomal protein [Patescibacteria group bacterium]